MKRTTYKITLSDGAGVRVTANSAAEAIEQALRECRGRTVVKCYTGMTAEECRTLKLIDHTSSPMPGIVLHDIPPHEAYSENATFPKAERRVDATEPMFDEEFIRFESQRAKQRTAK